MERIAFHIVLQYSIVCADVLMLTLNITLLSSVLMLDAASVKLIFVAIRLYSRFKLGSGSFLTR